MSTKLPSDEDGRAVREAAVRFGVGLFSVRQNADTTYTAGDWRLITFDAENYNPFGWFDITTNNRFTPKKAGYYQFNVSLYFTAVRTHFIQVALYVNGASARILGTTYSSTAVGGSCIHYMNGSTDYADIRIFPNTDNVTLDSGANTNYFDGVLISTAKR